jgi:hypothetical protein
MLYKQNNSHSILGDVIDQQSLWGGTLADLDHSGKDDVVGYGGINDSIYAQHVDKDGNHFFVPDSIYYAFKWSGTSYDVLGRMPNNSPVNRYNNPSNSYSEPNAAHADLQGNGLQDLITIDNDADLVVYEYDANSPTKFKTVYMEPNDGQGEGSWVTTGDFDGDGRPDIAYAYQSTFNNIDALGEYSVSYWNVKVLRNLDSLKFETVFSDRFYYAKPPSISHIPYYSSVQAIRNVTGRKGDDLVLSLYPNFYLLEFDTASRMMKPIWHYPVSASPRGALAYDFDQNGKREFGFVVGDSILFFEHDDNYAGQTPAPGGLNASPMGQSVLLDWGEVAGAKRYNVYRSSHRDGPYLLMGFTLGTSVKDTGLTIGDTFSYAVTAVDSQFAIPESKPCVPQVAYVHAIPELTRVDVVSRSIVRLHTSQVLRTNALSGGAIIVDDTLTPSSVTVAGDSIIEIGFAQPLPPGRHFARVNSYELRDQFNSPFDTTLHIAWQTLPDSIPNRFYIVRWNFEQLTSGVRIHVVFNEAPGTNALDGSHYSLSPYGTLVRVYVDVGSDMQLVALGVPFVLCVKEITSASNTPLDAREGNCAGVSFTEPTLANVMVYPNPAKQSDGKLTFSRLTAQAEIRIYTLNMRFIRHLATTEQLGGAIWDMRDENGNPVPSGMYLYYATGKDDTGTAVDGKAAKLVIVNDTKE